MAHVLVVLMSQLTSLTPEEATAIEKSFPIKTFPAGRQLLRETQVATDAYYVIEGCIREYELLDGIERTTAFYTEGDSAINFSSLANHSGSRVYFECTEATTVAVLNTVKEEALYRQFPRFETFCRAGMEKMMGDKHNQLAAFITLKPEQRYRKLLTERPDLLNRVPQYQIASYLGVQPETLSRIRRKLTKS